MEISILLNLRYQFEAIVSFRKSFDLPSYNSDINSLRWFINNGHKSNRFRKRYGEAKQIAETIVNEYEKSLGCMGKQLAR